MTPWRPPDDAPCVAATQSVGPFEGPRWSEKTDAELARFGVKRLEDGTYIIRGVNFFTDREDADYDQGIKARSECQPCPVRTLCLSASVARNERYGIWGGAGQARRRALRRAYGTPDWQRTVEAHFRRLDGHPALPGDDELLEVAGAGMAHGHRGCFAKGCRCDDCAQAASLEGARAAAGVERNLSAAVTSWTQGAA